MPENIPGQVDIEQYLIDLAAKDQKMRFMLVLQTPEKFSADLVQFATESVANTPQIDELVKRDLFISDATNALFLFRTMLNKPDIIQNLFENIEVGRAILLIATHADMFPDLQLVFYLNFKSWNSQAYEEHMYNLEQRIKAGYSKILMALTFLFYHLNNCIRYFQIS